MEADDELLAARPFDKGDGAGRVLVEVHFVGQAVAGVVFGGATDGLGLGLTGQALAVGGDAAVAKGDLGEDGFGHES